MRLLIPLVVVCLIATSSALSKSDRKKKVKVMEEEKEEPAEQGGGEGWRERLEKSLRHSPMDASVSSVLEGHEDSALEGDGRQTSGPVLVYVTPWSPSGYDRAREQASRLTHVAPVWLQLKPQTSDGSRSCKIEGTHDIDHRWMDSLKEANADIKIVPRVIFEEWQLKDTVAFFQSESWSQHCLVDLTNFLQRNQFDGVVLEMWTSLVYSTEGRAIAAMMELLEQWGRHLHDHDLQVILPVGPLVDDQGEPTHMFSSSMMHALRKSVDYVQIMTYDYPARKPVGVAPITWVRENVERVTEGDKSLADQVLIGLNHYGYEWTKKSAEAVTAGRYLEVLSRPEAQLMWNEETGEHVVKYSDGVVLFPSLSSVEMRMRLARELRVGVAVWELGQGLAHFAKAL